MIGSIGLVGFMAAFAPEMAGGGGNRSAKSGGNCCDQTDGTDETDAWSSSAARGCEPMITEFIDSEAIGRTMQQKGPETMSDMPNQPRKRKSKAQRCQLDLTMPPRVNQFSHASGRGDVYERWLAVAGEELKGQKAIAITGPAAMRVRAALPERLHDLTALAKALRDLLVAHGVIADDTAVVDWEMAWDRTVEPGRCMVALWRTSPPHQRISRESRRRVSARLTHHWAEARAAKVCHA